LAAQAKPSILPPKKALAHGLEGISVIGLRLLLTACPQGTCDRGQTGSIATAGLPCRQPAHSEARTDWKQEEQAKNQSRYPQFKPSDRATSREISRRNRS